MSKIIQISMPDDVFLGLRKSPEELATDLRLAAAVKWYEAGMVSQGKAAEIAGLSRAEFIAALTQFSVSPFQETPEEILQAGREETT